MTPDPAPDETERAPRIWWSPSTRSFYHLFGDEVLFRSVCEPGHEMYTGLKPVPADAVELAADELSREGQDMGLDGGVRLVDLMRTDLVPWRTGRKVGRTVYVGDALVGLMDTPAMAEQVVQAVNAELKAGRDVPIPATFCAHHGDDSYFDRTLCAPPYDTMHTRCTECHAPLDRCAHTTHPLSEQCIHCATPARLASADPCPRSECPYED